MAAGRLKVFRAACVQINAGRDWKRNFDFSLRQVFRALKKKAHAIAFPENFLWRGPAEQMPEIARTVPQEVIPVFQELAREHRVSFLLGSLILPVRSSRKYASTSILISESGKIAASYQKIHLFDISLKALKVRESEHFLHGRRVVSGVSFGVRWGLSICYDLRFPELYRNLSLQNCQILCVPANFTYRTGKAHWETLLRARAIENQCFVVAPAQCGVHPGSGIRSFGRSMIIDAWGNVLGRLDGSEEGILTADLDLEAQEKLSREFPVLAHRKLRLI